MDWVQKLSKVSNYFEKIMEEKYPTTKTKYDDLKSNFVTWEKLTIGGHGTELIKRLL